MVAAQQTELTAARAGLLEQRYEFEALRARLARALRVAFGRSSEKLLAFHGDGRIVLIANQNAWRRTATVANDLAASTAFKN